MRVPVPLLPRPVRWLGVAGLLGFLFYVSVVTVPPETAVDTYRLSFVDVAHWRHFVAYGTLAYALAYATVDWELTRWKQAAFVVAFASLYGLGIEVGQYFTPHRNFDATDVVANTLGASLVLPWYLLWPHVRPYVRLVKIRARST